MGSFERFEGLEMRPLQIATSLVALAGPTVTLVSTNVVQQARFGQSTSTPAALTGMS